MNEEINLRWACLQLASAQEWVWDTEEALKLAEAYMAFLSVDRAGRGVPHNVANLHPAHPTIQ